MTNNLEKELEAKVKEIVETQGAELIEFKVFSYRGQHTLRCLVDYPQGGITISDCANINEELSRYLEKVSGLGQNWQLEVNSPGLDRRLKSQKDFLRVKGRTVSLWYTLPEGDKFFEGELIDVNDKGLTLKNKDSVLNISFAQVKLGKEKVKI